MPNLQSDLRSYCALNNHLGAERMMSKAAEALDAKDAVIAELVKALTLVTKKVPMISGIRVVCDIALCLADQGSVE